jgi:serine protease
MKRCLHITIHEGSGEALRRAAPYRPRGAGSDPGSDYVMPPVDDPGSDYVMPPVDDPGADYVMPPVDDPGSDYVMPPVDDPRSGVPPSGGSGGTVTVQPCGCCCAPAGPLGTAEPRGSAAPSPFVRSRDSSGFVIVRTADGVVAKDSLAESLWALAEEHTPKLTGLKAVLELPIETAKGGQEPAQPEAVLPASGPPPGILVSRPLIELVGQPRGPGYPLPPSVPLQRAQCLRLIRELERKAATTAFPPLHSLAAYWRLDLREHPDLVEEVVARLNRLAEVDLAYRELAAADPQLTNASPGYIFAEDQGYLDDAPTGIGAAWAWKRLAELPSPKPQVTLCDLEQGWTTDHLDLKPVVPPSPFYGANRAPDEGNTGHHGTAVLGQLAAAGRVKGAAAELGQFVLASHYKAKSAKEANGGPHPFAGTNGHVAAAIVQALPKPQVPGNQLPSPGPLKEGDILLLEVQRGLLPAEVDEADFDAIRLASAHGVIVVEAAGNGGFDLDGYADPETRRSLRRGASGFRDSGAIFVGAARAGVPHDRAPFSNYGSRLDCFGWGEAVTTCGYGDLAGTEATDFYTNAFSGTSSAAPIIAGAAALVQALHKAQAGYWLGPRAMRALLSDPATGTRQGPNVSGHIGVMPDLAAIVRGRLQLVPDVYLRRHLGDDGSAPGLDEEISSSPDILVWTGKENASDHFGEGPRAHVPAPGSPLNPAKPNEIYPGEPGKTINLHVRLRNRGVGPGRAQVQVFASYAATLITPEHWLPIGSVGVQDIPEGDTLTVSPAVPVNPPQQWPQKASEWPGGIVPAYSFLAVQLPAAGAPPQHAPGYERTILLPPGPPYFDWSRFRSFLRGPGVAWRNIHPIKAGADMTLAFLLAGTPDRARHFDFEVIQRLPAAAEVTLKVPEGLAAKLRQRQPWLAAGSGSLSLPRRPRTAFSQVALAPGIRIQAAFQVKVAAKTGAKPSILRGHSLAVRQLWRGEEVGRITWWFLTE